MRYEEDDIPALTKAGYIATNAVARAFIGAALALPYSWRVPFMGLMVSRIIGPAAGFMRRAEKHVAFILPHLPHAEHRRIARASLDNLGRTLIENYSTKALLNRHKGARIDGPGLAALQEATDKGQAVILVSGHFGNYEAPRAALLGAGFDVGGLYRDMANPYFNAHYVRTMHDLGGPMFAQGRKGTAGFVRHLKSGGQAVILVDQHVLRAPVFDFLGHPAHTSTSAADLALRYNTLVIPFFGIRRADGLTFDLILDAPIPHSDAGTMTQAINDSIGARIRAHPEQWLWVARRWRAPT